MSEYKLTLMGGFVCLLFFFCFVGVFLFVCLFGGGGGRGAGGCLVGWVCLFVRNHICRVLSLKY